MDLERIPPTETPGYRRIELTVGEATLGSTPAEVAAAVRTLLLGATAAGPDDAGDESGAAS